MKPRIYLETSILSYLTAWRSRDLVTAAHQQITREWWDTRRMQFELYVSQIVIQESSAGDDVLPNGDLILLRTSPCWTLTNM